MTWIALKMLTGDRGKYLGMVLGIAFSSLLIAQQCDSSTKAAKRLDAAGFESVYDFEAGAKGWQEAGEKLEAPTS